MGKHRGDREKKYKIPSEKVKRLCLNYEDPGCQKYFIADGRFMRRCPRCNAIEKYG